mgnify:CR=1 FL=1
MFILRYNVKEVTIWKAKIVINSSLEKMSLTLTTDKDNLFMEEVERVAKEKYNTIKEKLPQADNETIAILMALNLLSTQLSREIEVEKNGKRIDGSPL